MLQSVSDGGKHCILEDASIYTVDQLEKAGLHPIVILVKCKSSHEIRYSSFHGDQSGLLFLLLFLLFQLIRNLPKVEMSRLSSSSRPKNSSSKVMVTTNNGYSRILQISRATFF